MKKILQITIFIISIGTYACVCDQPSITEKYSQSDFVANIKIIKIYKNKGSKELYKVDIQIRDLYKGEKLKSIYVAGRSDGRMGSSCAIFIPENIELIAYARKNKNGEYIIGMCSGLLYLNNRYPTQKNRELEILEMFQAKDIDFTNKIDYQEKATLSKKLEEFKGIKLDKNYGIYEITFSSNLEIKEIKEISGFNNNSLDEKLIDIIKTTKWTSFNNGIRNKVLENSIMLIGIYYYESEKNNPSFLSQFYL